MLPIEVFIFYIVAKPVGKIDTIPCLGGGFYGLLSL